jgi:hypothetical protein
MNGLCSPGRIRPGLRAKRAMGMFRANAAADTAQAMTRVAVRRGTDECVHPYTIDVENR